MQRKFLRVLAATASLGLSLAAAAPAVHAADTWPSRTIRYIVPFSPGGVSDGVARLIAEQLTKRLGQSVIVENKPGVSGIVGTQLVARADPDGYTIVGGTITTHAVNPFFVKSLGYDPVKDFTPVALVGMVSNALVVRADSPYTSVQAVIDAARAKPDTLTYGTAGPGTSQHLSGQLFQSISGTRLRQIVYKGGSQSMIDLIGGQIDMVFDTVAAARPMIDSGKVKVLGVTSAKPLADLPQAKPLAELGLPGFEMQSWQGIFAPAGTPAPVVDRIAREIAAAVATPEVKAKLLMLGVAPDGRGSAEFAAFQRSEIDKWGKVIKDAGIQAD
ncbi:tripartite tricarboxylate transporter substrate binding protein [Bordetella sp. N]|uniref:Bug family tripartite tricarboxylate transporter substrate binding protein n=1 Tax=Bordetella sp. N TaxID=1746199 RepID=UPI00070A414F|nr:tripartite tricarboxylate transporter substrate binding protein [Bordetella sp. N]ALM82895.1 MFS transporter [Bordetella sp. N]